jgi:hypothetical protein
MFNDSTFRFQSLFPSLRPVERSLPLVNGFEMFGYEALKLGAIHSAIIMLQPFSGSNQPSLPDQAIKSTCRRMHFAAYFALLSLLPEFWSARRRFMPGSIGPPDTPPNRVLKSVFFQHFELVRTCGHLSRPL